MPAAAPYVRRLRVDVSKNVSTAASSQEGEFVTSTTTEVPLSASESPSPVMLLTPVVGAAATTSCPSSRRILTSFDPMSPVPPTTTIFMILLSFDRDPSRSLCAARTAHGFVKTLIYRFEMMRDQLQIVT